MPVYFKGQYVAGIHLRFMKRVMSQTKLTQQLPPKLRTAAAEIEERVAAMITEKPHLYSHISGPLLVS